MAYTGDWDQSCSRSLWASSQRTDAGCALDEGAAAVAWQAVGHHPVLVQLLVHGLQQNLGLFEEMQSLH